MVSKNRTGGVLKNQTLFCHYKLNVDKINSATGEQQLFLSNAFFVPSVR